MFGKGKKRVALIKELAETRFQARGISSTETRLTIKSLGSFGAMSLPEASIVIILEGIVKAQNQGVPLSQVLLKFERQRSGQGHHAETFSKITSRANGDNPASAMIDYLHYRNQLEAPPNGRLSWHEVADMIGIAYPQIRSW